MITNINNTKFLTHYQNQLLNKFELVSYNISRANDPKFEKLNYTSEYDVNGLHKYNITSYSDKIMLGEINKTNSELSYASKKTEIYNLFSNIIGSTESGTSSINDYPTNINNAVNKIFESVQKLYYDPSSNSHKLLFKEKTNEFALFLNDTTKKLYTLYNEMTKEVNKDFEIINNKIIELDEINNQISSGILDDISIQECFVKQKEIIKDISSKIEIQYYFNDDNTVKVNSYNNHYQILNKTLKAQFDYNNTYDINSNYEEEEFSVKLKTYINEDDHYILKSQDLGKGSILALIEMKKEIEKSLEDLNLLAFNFIEEINRVQNQGVKIEGYDNIISKAKYSKNDILNNNNDIEFVMMDKITGDKLSFTENIHIKPYRSNLLNHTVNDLLQDINHFFVVPKHIEDEYIKSIRLVNKGIENNNFIFNIELDNQSDNIIDIKLDNFKITYKADTSEKDIMIDVSDDALDIKEYTTQIHNEYINNALQQNIKVNLDSIPKCTENIYIEMDVRYNDKILPIKYKINLDTMNLSTNNLLRIDLAHDSPTEGHLLYNKNHQLLFANLIDDNCNTITNNREIGKLNLKTSSDKNAIYINEISTNTESKNNFLTQAQFFNIFNHDDVFKHTANSIVSTGVELHNTILDKKIDSIYEVAISDNTNIKKVLDLKYKNIKFDENNITTIDNYSINIIETTILNLDKQQNTYYTYDKYNEFINAKYQNKTGVNLIDEKREAQEIQQQMDITNEMLKIHSELFQSILKVLNH